MRPLRHFAYIVSGTVFFSCQGASASSEYSLAFGSNGFANWGSGTWPPSNVGVPLVPQTTDPDTLALLTQMDPKRIQSTIQTLVNFGTRHTASDTASPTRGIGAAQNWLLSEMTELAKTSNGLMNVSMPCYLQEAQPSSDMPIAAEVCNVQVEIKGAIDPNRTYVYTGHYDSRRLNGRNNIDDGKLKPFLGIHNAQFWTAPGADDNASAVSIALEMVRILAPYVAKSPPAASIIIAAVAGEEQGLYGSNFLAQTRV
jgi:acetylornithine deacetylase/succinyl-diaminopimelate desuccinylase-like protein